MLESDTHVVSGDGVFEEKETNAQSEGYTGETSKLTLDSSMPEGEVVPGAAGSSTTSISDDDVAKLREELKNNLQEEQVLTTLQMQLLLQWDTLKASIAAAESEERMAKLALQQAAEIQLMKKTQDPDSNVDDEAITIKLSS